MADFLYSDGTKPNLDHPDSAIRLACAVHRFRAPRIFRKVSFVQSFRTVSQETPTTRRLMQTADEARTQLEEALSATKLSAERVLSTTQRYQSMIHSILLSCKVQPEEARLDERLIFGWASGIEQEPKGFKSEAIMYDLVMIVVSEGLAYAVRATENSIAGEFAPASRDYASAAGIFAYLAEDQLPKWISKGSKVDDDNLPSECHAPMAKAISILFMATGQQMAVATVLMKPGTPNYSLLAKLCCGISQQLEDFIALVRREAMKQMARMDKDFFTVVQFQIGLQKSLSLYFQARALWEKDDHGTAIAMLSEATVALRSKITTEQGAGAGVPDISANPALRVLLPDLTDLRTHMAFVLHHWEKDNSSVYFAVVPQSIPAGKKLQDGHRMNRTTPYSLQFAEPVLLKLPASADGKSPVPAPLERSDSDLARELHRRWSTGEEEEA